MASLVGLKNLELNGVQEEALLLRDTCVIIFVILKLFLKYRGL